MTEVRLEEKSEKTKQERQRDRSLVRSRPCCVAAFRDEDDEMNEGQGR